ncbi:hypothetical protein [Duganella qianjiadongensis]|uniref:Uncharacterized protein n=1 Tax=Duganella qianjiadongensis TaxID=2692176 RepID=A0ABW9VQM7_9BURK|nr:hypothetical protein [Duganella qianjiadongensis]MYM40022.1 hypothetical protein [Duganella qianjiadongensis]
MFINPIGNCKNLWEVATRALPKFGNTAAVPGDEGSITQSEPAASPFAAGVPKQDDASAMPPAEKQKLDVQQAPAPQEAAPSATQSSMTSTRKQARNLVTVMKWTVGVAAVVAGVTAGLAVGTAAGVLRKAGGAEIEKSLDTLNDCIKGGYYAGASVFYGLGKLADLLDQSTPDAGAAVQAGPAAAAPTEFVLV